MQVLLQPRSEARSLNRQGLNIDGQKMKFSANRKDSDYLLYWHNSLLLPRRMNVHARGNFLF